MTAPRTCRTCGAELAGNVMWFLRCHEPVRQLTPRESRPPGIVFLPSGPQHPTSRWPTGPNVVGPVARILVTALVLALFPRPERAADIPGIATAAVALPRARNRRPVRWVLTVLAWLPCPMTQLNT